MLMNESRLLSAVGGDASGSQPPDASLSLEGCDPTPVVDKVGPAPELDSVRLWVSRLRFAHAFRRGFGLAPGVHVPGSTRT
jgi:hypothetical protein